MDGVKHLRRFLESRHVYFRKNLERGTKPGYLRCDKLFPIKLCCEATADATRKPNAALHRRGACYGEGGAGLGLGGGVGVCD